MYDSLDWNLVMCHVLFTSTTIPYINSYFSHYVLRILCTSTILPYLNCYLFDKNTIYEEYLRCYYYTNRTIHIHGYCWLCLPWSLVRSLFCNLSLSHVMRNVKILTFVKFLSSSSRIMLAVSGKVTFFSSLKILDSWIFTV